MKIVHLTMSIRPMDDLISKMYLYSECGVAVLEYPQRRMQPPKPLQPFKHTTDGVTCTECLTHFAAKKLAVSNV